MDTRLLTFLLCFCGLSLFGQGAVRTYDTASALSGLPVSQLFPESKGTVILRGLNAPNDGKGGIFYLDMASTAASSEDTVLANPTGRFIRIGTTNLSVLGIPVKKINFSNLGDVQFTLSSTDLSGTLASIGVPGVYSNAVISVDSKGRIVAASSGTSTSSSVLVNGVIASPARLTNSAFFSFNYDGSAITVLPVVAPLISPGAYQNANVTVDAYGRVTEIAANPPVIYSAYLGESWPFPVTLDIGSTGVYPVNDSGKLTWELSTTGVTPGSYSTANFTVDSYGRITAASNGSSGVGTNASRIFFNASPVDAPNFQDNSIFGWTGSSITNIQLYLIDRDWGFFSTVSGAATLDNSAISYAKLQNQTARTILGRRDDSSGAPEELIVTNGLHVIGTTLELNLQPGANITATTNATTGRITWDVVVSTGTNTAAVRVNGSLVNNASLTDNNSIVFYASGSNVTATIAGRNFGDWTMNPAGTTATINNGVVTYAKMQSSTAASRLLGKGSSGPGTLEELSIGAGLGISGTTLNNTQSPGVGTNAFVNGVLRQPFKLVDSSELAWNVDGSGNISGNVNFPAGTGTDVSIEGVYASSINFPDTSEMDWTIVGSDAQASLKAASVSLNKVQQIPTQRVLGRSSVGTGSIEQLTLGSGLLLSGGILSSTATGSSTNWYDGVPVQNPNYQDNTETDWTVVGTNINVTLKSASVALSKVANVATGTLLGRSSAGTGSLQSLTPGTGLSISGGVVSVTTGWSLPIVAWGVATFDSGTGNWTLLSSNNVTGVTSSPSPNPYTTFTLSSVTTTNYFLEANVARWGRDTGYYLNVYLDRSSNATNSAVVVFSGTGNATEPNDKDLLSFRLIKLTP